MINFLNPDYLDILQEREKRLNFIRENPQHLSYLKQHYKEQPIDFINDWGVTFDPRNPRKNLPSLVPFILMPKQEEWVNWLIEKWQTGKPGLVEKTRTVGMSWLSVATACTLCLFNQGLVIGFGSRKQEYVDKRGNMKALLPKARLFLKFIPHEFLDGFDLRKDAPFMIINFKNDSQIVGESGDGIGRGDRTSIYIVDESAFLERPELIEASLSETTDCRVDVSTPNGMGNPFEIKRHSGKIDVFTFHWKDDLRRDEEWYKKKCEELDPVTVAQELDINYNASVDYLVIPYIWIQSAIDAHIKLGIDVAGEAIAALDVADAGADKNAFVKRKGILLDYAEDWTGKDSDIGYTTTKTINLCDDHGVEYFFYDADGVGAGVKGFARIINESRAQNSQIIYTAFHGSGAVYNPDEVINGDKKNKDFFMNKKSQAWWQLRKLFENTHKAVNKQIDNYNVDEIISIDSNLKNLNKLKSELNQPIYSINTAGKILINKAPNVTKSPNLADAVMMCYNQCYYRDLLAEMDLR